MLIFRCTGLCEAGTRGMIWNEIRTQFLERLPKIIDFVLFGMVMTALAAVLLGLAWLYVQYGMALFVVGVALVFLPGLLSERRRPIHFEGGPIVLSGDPALPPPGKRSLPAPGLGQLGRSSTALTKHRPTLPERGPK
jgi:hypothetical protein